LEQRGVEIRILTEADTEAWRRLRLEALERDPEAFSSSVEEHGRLSFEDVRNRIACDAETRFVVGAFANGELVGMAGFYRETGPKTRHKGHVWGVYVTMTTRGRGIGKKLMEALLVCAMQIPGLEQIHLAVTSSQVAAMGLYQALGFEPFARESKALKIGERYIDEEFMVLWLPGRDTR
jgi:ribosomal protein S18 acetylase RimI-like enzyme